MFSSGLISRIFIAFILFSLSWLPANAQSEAESIVEGWVNSADEYSFVNISYDSVNHDSTSNITSISNLKIELNKDSRNDGDETGSNEEGITGKNSKSRFDFRYTFNFPVVEFENLSFDGDYYSAGTISAERILVNFAISNTSKSDSTAGGVYNNLQFDNVRWVSLPEIVEDEQKPVSSYFPLIEAMLDISFDKASLGSLSMVQQNEKPALTIRTDYGRMEIGNAYRGNFSTMHAEGMKMEIESAEQNPQLFPSTRIEFGKMQATDYNYRTLLDHFSGPVNNAESDSLFKTFMGDLSLDNVQVTSKAGDFSLQSITATGVDVRSPDIDILAEADRLIAAAKAGDGSKNEKEIIRLVTSFYAMFRLNKFQMSEMKFYSPKSGDGRMDVFRIADLSSDGMGEFLLEGINFTDHKAMHFNLDHYSLSELSFPPFEALLNLETASKSKNIPEILKAIPTLANLTIKGLNFVIPNKGKVSIEENSITMSDFIGPIPTDIQVLVKNLNVPTALMDREPRQMLSSMGYNEVDLSYDISAIWEAKTNVVTLQSGVELADGGLVNFDVAIGGIPRSIFENPQTLQSAVAFATLDNAEATLVDNSIVEKGLTLAGATQGVNADTMKAQVVGMLPIMLQVLEKPAFVDNLTATVKNFLDNKGSITASAQPASPVLILQLLGAGATAPGAVIDLLNVNVVTE